jgi:hypothetical protein
MTGYSGTPLPRKLGIGENMRVTMIDPPDDFEHTLGRLPDGVEMSTEPGTSDVFILFATRAVDIEELYEMAMGHIGPEGAIWVAWPKRSSGVPTDLTGDVMRQLFLPTGMVDNKVCAIDETWSALRFVVRRENRDSWDD